MKYKILAALLITALVCVCIIQIPITQAVFDVNLTVRNGTVYVNNLKTNISKIATFTGSPYVPLNLVGPYFGMVYEKNNDESVVSFSYEGNKLEIDFVNKKTKVNGKDYTLLYGVSKKTISNKTYIFLGNYDIQNIFGIITSYDKDTLTTKIDTGFGVIDVDYSQDGGYQTESNMAKAKVKLLTYANSIAANLKGSITVIDKTEVSNIVDSVFKSINAPITENEYKNGIKISGLSYNNTSQTNLTYIKNIKFLASLGNITTTPEYVKVYEINSQNNNLYVVGTFFAFEGLDISDEDIITAVVASIEDSLNQTLSQKSYKDVAAKVKTIASTLRKDSKMLVLVINNRTIGAVELLWYWSVYCAKKQIYKRRVQI